MIVCWDMGFINDIKEIHCSKKLQKGSQSADFFPPANTPNYCPTHRHLSINKTDCGTLPHSLRNTPLSIYPAKKVLEASDTSSYTPNTSSSYPIQRPHLAIAQPTSAPTFIAHLTLSSFMPLYLRQGTE